MKTKKTIVKALLLAFLFPVIAFSQSKWSENDDMYFSKKDRSKIYASVETLENSLKGQSEYTANHNFESPTAQQAGSPDDINNQYFIKDYSLPKDKTYESVPTNIYGSAPSFNNRPNVNMAFGMGYGFGSPYFGNSFNRFYNPFNDPFSPYYDPFFSYNDPWNNNSFGYNSFGYNPWGYNRYGSWGNNRFGYNGFYNTANWCPTNGYTNYSNNVRNEVRYRNGRKVISGSRSASTTSRSNRGAVSNRPVKNTDGTVKTNGRSSSRASRSSYRKYPNSVQNRAANNSNSRTNRVNTSNRTNRNSSNSNWNNNPNHNRSSNNYRSSGSSSGSRSSSYSRPSSGSRSSGSVRPSSGGSRSGSSRGRGNN